jgi:hypothetical protein
LIGQGEAVLNALTGNDPVFIEPKEGERPGIFARAALRLIIDRRDLPFIKTMFVLTTFVVAPAIALAWPGHFRWWLAIPYLAIYGFFLGPYTLMLHNTSHRKLFQRKNDWLNYIVPFVLGPFFGQTPYTYFAHHVEMHHKEDNLPDDLSSTMKYQRDSIFGWLHYFLTFYFIGLAQLTTYFVKQGRYKLAIKTLAGEFSFFAGAAALIHYDWRVGLTIMVLPFTITRFAMMAGNWAQHAFIDAETPGNNYRNSITCIDSTYNRRCFNDGYHIGHHIRRVRHWTEMPGDFLATKDKYRDENAIVFQGVDFFVVWFFLMLKRYDWMAARFVDLRDDKRSKDEIIALLKQRTRRIEPAVEPEESAASLPA